MKYTFFILFIILNFSSYSVFADVHVHGYYRKNGTYVQLHYRSDPNCTEKDNWSTKGNINPHTGKKGTKKATRFCHKEKR